MQIFPAKVSRQDIYIIEEEILFSSGFQLNGHAAAHVRVRRDGLGDFHPFQSAVL